MTRLLAALAGLVLVAACASPRVTLSRVDHMPEPVAGALAPHERRCATVFGHAGAASVWLIENRCADAAQRRITLIDAAGIRRFASYDAAFTGWAWAEGCNSPSACGYEVQLKDGVVTRFVYRFDINLRAGDIEVVVDHDRLTVVHRTVIDQPS